MVIIRVAVQGAIMIVEGKTAPIVVEGVDKYPITVTVVVVDKDKDGERRMTACTYPAASLIL